MKVCIINGNEQYVKMFKDRGWDIIPQPFEADLIQFTGGADVSPFIYGQENIASHCDYNRDLFEAGIFAIAKRMGIPMAGICRGGQFLNVMCGGSMIQDIPNHAIGGKHKALCFDDNTMKVPVVEVTSTHHQAMLTNNIWECETIAVSEDGINEIVYYDEYNCLCFQPHPEFHNADECRDCYFDLLEQYLGVN